MRPLVLNDAFKHFTDDQDKIVHPEETVSRFMDKISALNLGILEEVVRIDNGRLDIPVYFSVCGPDAEAVTGTRKQMGKGATPVQAKASAVMELAERYSFFTFCQTPGNFLTDTYQNVCETAVPYEMFARSVHDDSDEPALLRGLFETLPLKWTRGFNLTRQAPVLIPFDWFYLINEFNGPSAGNCVEEALSQGICELVERHVSSLVSRRQLKVPLIRPDSAADPAVREMLGKYARAGIQLYISDFSLDTGIPTVGVLAYDPATFPAKSEIVWTAGTTPSAEKALSRALTEVAQLAGDFNTGSRYVASGLPKFKSLSEAGFIMDPGRSVDLSALPDLSDRNIKTEVESLIAALGRQRMEVITLETTHPRLQIPAFYTVIPGAHFRERAAGASMGMFMAKLVAETLPPREALARLTAMDAALPGRYYVHFYLGTLHLSLDAPETARGHLEKALALDPREEDIPSICAYMGICLKDTERFREALEILQKGVAVDDERPDIYNLMGFCHFKLKAHPEAIDCFRKALTLNPSSAIDYANIASNYRELGDREKAVEYYELALALDPSITFARENLERLQARQG